MINHTELVNICSAFIAPKSIITSEQLLDGLSNDNFLVRTEQQAYLLKCYKQHWPEVGLEAQRVLSNQNVCPAPIWLDKANKHAAFNYIEGGSAHSGLTQNLVSKLAKMHGYSITTQPMKIAQELLFYKQSRIYQQYQPAIKHALDTVTKMPFNAGFCHNDLVTENIIENATGMYLIDFEYAKTNDVYFDLAALAVSFKLNKKSDKILLAHYQKCQQGRGDFVQSINKLNCYKLLYLVLCIGWYEQRAIKTESLQLNAQLYQLTTFIDL